MDYDHLQRQIDDHEDRLTVVETRQEAYELNQKEIKDLVELLKQVRSAFAFFIYLMKAVKWLGTVFLVGYFFLKKDFSDLAQFFHSDTTR